MKPIIGVIGRLDTIEEKYTTFCMYENIRRAIVCGGGIPLLIVPTNSIKYFESIPSEECSLSDLDKEDLRRMVDLCSGILIPGTNRLMEYDKYIYEYSYSKNLPILGICGGMQLFGIINGHKEYLSEIKTNINHNMPGVEKAHSISVIPNTRLNEMLNKEKIVVNSRHKMALANSGEFIISATSDDGTIEALEHPTKPIIGVQWHPEVLIENDENSKQLFKQFIRMCK